MLFIPLSNEFLYPLLEAKGFNIQPLRRMEYGMFFTAVAFFASTLLEYSIQRGPPNSISLAWQIPQITILTVAEILLNVTGLEVSLIFTFILLFMYIHASNFGVLFCFYFLSRPIQVALDTSSSTTTYIGLLCMFSLVCLQSST